MFETLRGHQDLFASGGASSIEPAHSLESFRLAIRLGATGLQGDLWVTSDGVAVFNTEGQSRSGFRRRPLNTVRSSELRAPAVSVSQFFEEFADQVDVMVAVRDPEAFEPLFEAVTTAHARARLWVMHTDVAVLGAWRERLPEAKLIHTSRTSELKRGLEQHAAVLRAAHVDGLSLGFDEWTAGHVAVMHRFSRLAIASGPQHERQISELLSMGMDAVASNQVERMVDSKRALD